jgi:hypothetical protein
MCISLHKGNEHYALKVVGACRPQVDSRLEVEPKLLKNKHKGITLKQFHDPINTPSFLKFIS